jgi:hypothetical protein
MVAFGCRNSWRRIFSITSKSARRLRLGRRARPFAQQQRVARRRTGVKLLRRAT